MGRHRSTVRFLVLVPFTLLVIAASAWLGPRWITLDEIRADGPGAYVFWNHRAPR